MWLWNWREGLREALATFRSAVDLMAEHPDYRFVASSAAFYEWAKRLDFRLLQAIRRRVREGRWEPVGGWWVEADENLPGGEGLLRQGIYGQKLFAELFGEHVSVAFNPDAFGHPSSLPRILRALGQTAFFFMRPSDVEKPLPSPVFRWRSSDGSEVMAVRIRSYNATTADVEPKISAVVDETRWAGLPAGVCFYGVGDHGGGPNRELLGLLDELREKSSAELVYSTPSAYLRSLDPVLPELPVIQEELRHHAVGCYSVDRGIKLRNRRAEHALLALERWQTVNWLANGQRPDVAALEDAWHTVLFNQFHDILAGTSIREAAEEARRALDGVLAYADEEQEFTLRRLAAQTPVPWPEGGFVVFNPWPWDVRAPVEFEYMRESMDEASGKPSALVTPDGEATLTQAVRRSDVTDLPRSRWVAVVDVPALGYKVLRLADLPSGKSGRRQELRVTATTLENRWLRLEIDPDGGFWHRLGSVEGENNLLNGPACLPVALKDRSDTWSHGVTSYVGRERGFRFLGLKIVEEGPVRVGVRTRWQLGCSRVEITNRLYADLPGVFVDVDVNWQTPRSVLQLLFSLSLEDAGSVAEEPYGWVERRRTHGEVPCQQWLAAEGRDPALEERRGLLVVNDGLWSYSLRSDVLRLTLLRSPLYAQHDPAKPQRRESYDVLDLGEHRFRFWVLPYSEELSTVSPFRLASVFNLGLRVVKMPGQAGSGPDTGSWLRVEPDNVLVTVVKKGFHRSELVLRCFETAGRKTQVKVHSEFLELNGSFEIGPHELATVAVRRSGGGSLEFVKLNALEEPL